MWWQICVFFPVDLFEFDESSSSRKLPLTTQILRTYICIYFLGRNGSPGKMAEKYHSVPGDPDGTPSLHMLPREH